MATAKKTGAAKKAAPKKDTKKVVAKTIPLKVTAKARDPKAVATRKKEPYVAVIGVELDDTNPGNGAFELDWNEYFVAKLVRAGYTGNDDAQIVDRWFQDICRNVVMENFEQWEANQPREDRLTLQRKDLGNGRTEVS
jgi:hypothetical protein